jgi:hypothetical protein
MVAFTRFTKLAEAAFYAPFGFALLIATTIVSWFSLSAAYVLDWCLTRVLYATLIVVAAALSCPLGPLLLCIARFVIVACCGLVATVSGYTALGTLGYYAVSVVMLATPVEAMKRSGAVATTAVALVAMAGVATSIGLVASPTKKRKGETAKARKAETKPWEALTLNFPGELAPLNTYSQVADQSHATGTNSKYYGIVFTNWGRKWAFEAELAVGSDATAAFTWVKGTGAEATIDNANMIRFLTWLYDGIDDEDTPAHFRATAGIYDDLLKAMKWFLDKQLALVGHTASELGYVRNMPGIKELTSSVSRGKAKKATEEQEDLQSDVDPTFTAQQWINIAVLLISCKQVTGDRDFAMTPFDFAMAYFIMLMSRALAARGEDIRGMVIGGFYWCLYECVGTAANGLGVLMIVLRCGKQNRSGRRTRSGVTAHRNPLLCPINALALSLLYRWLVQRETRPNWGDSSLFGSLFSPVLRSPTAANVPMSYDKHDGICKQVFRFFGLVTSHSTHHMRGDTARYLELCLVSIEIIKKHMNRVDNAHANSYGTGAAIQAILAAAGFQSDKPSLAVAAHFVDNEALLSKITALILPWLEDEKAKLVAASVVSGATVESFKRDRFFMRRNSLMALEQIIFVFIQCAAARPRNAKGQIDTDQPPMYKQFASNPVYGVLKTEVFESAEFKQLQALVKASEESEVANASSDAALLAGASPSTHLAEKLKPQFDKIVAGQKEANRQLFAFMQQHQQHWQPQESSSSSTSTSTSSSSTSTSSTSSTSSSSSASAAAATYAAATASPPATNTARLAGPLTFGKAPTSMRSRHTKVGAGQYQIAELGLVLSAQEMFDNCFKGSNSYMALEANLKTNRWRLYGHAAAEAWSQMQPFIRFMESHDDEARAVSALQALAVAAGHQGAALAPDWKKVGRDLKLMPVEIGFQAQRKSKAALNKAKALSRKQTPQVSTIEEEPVAEFNRDGSLVEENTPVTTATHHA